MVQLPCDMSALETPENILEAVRAIRIPKWVALTKSK